MADSNELNVSLRAKATTLMRVLIKRNEQIYGPYTVDQANDYIAAARLSCADAAQIEGTSEWKRLDSVLGLVAPPTISAMRPAPAPVEGPAGKGRTATIFVPVAFGVLFLGFVSFAILSARNEPVNKAKGASGSVSHPGGPRIGPTETALQGGEESATTPSSQQAQTVQKVMELASKCAEEHWIIQENGALWFGHVLDGGSSPADGGEVQFKRVTAQLVPEEISEADRLNGIDWRASVNFSAPACRVKANPRRSFTESWTEWQPLTLRTFWSVKVEKRFGNWTANEQQFLLYTTQLGAVVYTVDSLKMRKPTTEEQ